MRRLAVLQGLAVVATITAIAGYVESAAVVRDHDPGHSNSGVVTRPIGQGVSSVAQRGCESVELALADASSVEPVTAAALREAMHATAMTGPQLDSWRPIEAELSSVGEALLKPGVQCRASPWTPERTFGGVLLEAGFLVRSRSDLEPAASARDILRGFALASRLIDSGADGPSVSGGVAIQQLALHEAGSLLSRSDDPEAMVILRDGLQNLGSRHSAFARVLPRVCSDQGDLLLAAFKGRNGALQKADISPVAAERWGLSPVLVNYGLERLFYDAERTQSRMREMCTAIMFQLFQPPDRRLSFEQLVAAEPSSIGNSLGEDAADEMMRVILPTVAKEEQAEAATAVLLTISAARLFVRSKGHEPVSTEEMVPGWLSRIPTDPYDAGGVVIDGGWVRSDAGDLPEGHGPALLFQMPIRLDKEDSR